MHDTWLIICGIGFIFLMTALGSALVFCFKKEFSPRLNAAFFGFASGVMLAASVWSLLLPAFEQAGAQWKQYAFIPVAIGFLFGAVFLYLFDKLIPKNKRQANGLEWKKAKRLFLAVTLHNIPEGLAVGFAFGAAWATGGAAAYVAALGLAVGIGVQNFPEGAAISLPMRTALKSKGKAFLYGVASGIAEPIFAVIGFFLAAYLRSLQPWLLAFSAGAMVFVVAEDLIPDARQSDNSALGAWGVMFGFAIMMILDVALG